MKLIVQIPAWDEEATIADVIGDIPRNIPNVDEVEVLVIDDGSTDRTVEVAREAGADHIISLYRNRGLATAFQVGLDACLKRGADIIVNTDADNQYPGDQIPLLVDQVITQHADLVIADRQVASVAHFSLQKRLLQKLGSWVVRVASSTSVPDAPSGFRAYTRETAMRLFVTTDFSYTIDNLIQAGRRNLNVCHVPIRTSETRASKLHGGNWNFVKRQGGTIVRSYASYEPLKTFVYLSSPFFVASAILWIRLAYFFIRDGFVLLGHIQSLMVAGILLITGVLVLMFGLLADRVGDNRRMIDEMMFRLRKFELDLIDSRREQSEV